MKLFLLLAAYNIMNQRKKVLFPEDKWIKKPVLFLISVIIHAVVLIFLIQAFAPVTFIHFPSPVTNLLITPREGMPLPAVPSSGAASGIPGAGSGGKEEGKEAQARPSLEERLSRLEQEASAPAAGPRPSGPMPPPPFHLSVSPRPGTSTFSLKLPVPEEKGPVTGPGTKSPSPSPHDYWKYVLATRPGREEKRTAPALGGGAGSGAGVGQVPRVSLEGPGYDLSPWAQEVVARIQKNWQIAAARTQLEKGTVRLLVIMEKNGEVSSLRIITSSQKAGFDRAALEAVRLSLPLPQLPVAFPSDLLEITLVFECDESRG